MPNLLLKISYDGTNFHGWQRQPGQRTVQGLLEEKLETLLRAPVALEGSSRTDAGVHALGQCATLRGDFKIPAARIPAALNNLLTDVCILSAEEKPEEFHARFSAIGKTYLYRFAVTPALTPPPTPALTPSPALTQASALTSTKIFLRNHAHLLAKRPNPDNMAEAAKLIEGTQDFACFQAAGGTPRETTVRTIFRIDVQNNTRTDLAGNSYEAIEIEITGDGFLYNMVRIIAGTLAEIGAGKLAPRDIIDIINSKDRSRAGPTAPPQGLYLKEVYFDKLAPALQLRG